MELSNLTRRACAGLVLAAVGLSSGAAIAQSGKWPNKPVTVIVAYPPGGMTDIVTRILAKELSAEFKQPFIVENRAGASGQVATEYAARQPADGYTLLVTATGYVIAPFTRAKVGYDPRKDLVPVATLVQTPNMIVINPSVPAKTFPEFLSWARKQPSIPYGTAGAGGSTHLGGELFRHVSGLPFVHVPYRGAAPAVQDTVSGQIQVAVQDSVTVSSFIHAGKLRPIAVTSARRSGTFPDVPTLQENGYKDLDVYTWLGLFAPAGTPPDVLQKLNETVSRVMHSQGMVASLSKQASEPMEARNLAQTRAFIDQELTKWSQLIKTTGVKVED
jgi:tripartite-type tricarboxylate transporter receptor subunit TctC